MARFTKLATPLLLIMSVSPTLADEGASGLYVPGNFGFGAGVTPDPGPTTPGRVRVGCGPRSLGAAALVDGDVE